MPNALYLKASPRGPRSHSIAVADAFLEAWLERHPEAIVTTRNLFEEELQPFDGPTLQAKYNVMHGLTHDPSQFHAWEQVRKRVDELKACAIVVMAVPMWNFSIPYALKHWIDLVVQPGVSFEDDGTNVIGLIPDRPVFIAYSSGGQYVPGTAREAWDHQKPYLELILNYMGLTNIRSVRVEATLAGEETVKDRRGKAMAAAREMAAGF